MFEIAAGDVDPSEELMVEKRRILRGHEQVVLSHSLVEIWTGQKEEATFDR